MIVKPERQRKTGQLGGRDTSHGNGAVGPHDQDFSRPVNDLQHGFLRHGMTGGGDQIVVFHIRRRHFAVALAAKYFKNRLLHPPEGAAFGKQPVFRSLRRTDGFAHGALSLFFRSLKYYHIKEAKAIFDSNKSEKRDL